MGRDFPTDKFISYVPRRTSIDNARNFAAKLAMELECDYLFFIDDDMILHEKTYTSLRENIERPGIDVAMALTYIRSYPFKPMFFKDAYPERKELEGLLHYEDFEDHIDPETHSVAVDAIGCACVLIKVDLIKKLEPPYFLTMPNMTEDVFFCMKAKNKFGKHNVGMVVDCGVPTGHLSDKTVVDHSSIKHLRKMYEDMRIVEVPLKMDRGEEYLAALGEEVESHANS